MNYILPKDLKTYCFFCRFVNDAASYRRCKRRCPDNYRVCWEKNLREELEMDCAIENEYKVQGLVGCSNCGSVRGTDLLFNRFMCDDCGHIECCGVEKQKEILGDEYLSINEQELSAMFKQIK